MIEMHPLTNCALESSRYSELEYIYIYIKKHLKQTKQNCQFQWPFYLYMYASQKNKKNVFLVIETDYFDRLKNKYKKSRK